MNIFISVDMEGIAGVVDWDQIRSGSESYERFQRIATNEVLQVVDILEMIEAERIIINEGHASMHNLLFEKFPTLVKIIQGKFKPYGMMQGISKGADAALFIGYHARHGTEKALLDHTFSAKQVLLNGKEVGEIGLNAHLAGHYGVPVVFVSGDDACCREAEAVIPGVTTVSTKTSISRFSAECNTPGAISALYKQELPSAFNSDLETLSFEEEIEMELRLSDTLKADAAMLVPGVERKGGCTVVYRSDNYPEIYRMFQLITMLDPDS